MTDDSYLLPICFYSSRTRIAPFEALYQETTSESSASEVDTQLEEGVQGYGCYSPLKLCIYNFSHSSSFLIRLTPLV